MVVCLLEAALESGTRAQRWQALLSVDEHAGIGAERMMFSEDIGELEARYDRWARIRWEPGEESYKQRVLPILQKLFMSVARQDSRDVLQHDALMVLSGLWGLEGWAAGVVDRECVAGWVFE